MRIHYLQHIASEGPGYMKRFMAANGHVVTATRLFDGELPPPVEEFDWLIIMGGPMGIHDEKRFSWLSLEKKFILQAIRADKLVLGICLGAQLVANVLGARVSKNPSREIGWFEINSHPLAANSIPGQIFPQRFEALHWHGDTFDIPDGATPLGASEACENQGFVIDNRILGMQFHLEFTPKTTRDLIAACSDELDNSRYVQTAEEILRDRRRFTHANMLMEKLLSAISEEYGHSHSIDGFIHTESDRNS